MKAACAGWRINCTELSTSVRQGSEHDAGSTHAHALTQLWQRVHGRAGLVTCEKPDGLSLARRAFYKALAPALGGTCTVMFTLMSLMYHPSLFPPLSHQFSLLRCLSSVAIRPCDYHFLFCCFPFFIPSSPLSLCFFGPHKAQLCPQGLNCLPNGWQNGALTWC